MPADASKGIACRKCGCRHFKTIRTRPAPGDRIQRVRECRHCGQRLVTIEAAAGAKPTPAVEDLTPEQQHGLLMRLLQLLAPRFRP